MVGEPAAAWRSGGAAPTAASTCGAATRLPGGTSQRALPTTLRSTRYSQPSSTRSMALPRSSRPGTCPTARKAPATELPSTLDVATSGGRPGTTCRVMNAGQRRCAGGSRGGRCGRCARRRPARGRSSRAASGRGSRRARWRLTTSCSALITCRQSTWADAPGLERAGAEHVAVDHDAGAGRSRRSRRRRGRRGRAAAVMRLPRIVTSSPSTITVPGSTVASSSDGPHRRGPEPDDPGEVEAAARGGRAGDVEGVHLHVGTRAGRSVTGWSSAGAPAGRRSCFGRVDAGGQLDRRTRTAPSRRPPRAPAADVTRTTDAWRRRRPSLAGRVARPTAPTSSAAADVPATSGQRGGASPRADRVAGDPLVSPVGAARASSGPGRPAARSGHAERSRADAERGAARRTSACGGARPCRGAAARACRPAWTSAPTSCTIVASRAQERPEPGGRGPAGPGPRPRRRRRSARRSRPGRARCSVGTRHRQPVTTSTSRTLSRAQPPERLGVEHGVALGRRG